MADHVRQQLREAVAAALTGLPTTGARVYKSRVYALSQLELPCLLISSPDEDVPKTLGVRQPVIYQRAVEIQVTIIVRAAGDLEAALDAIAKEVEAPLGNGLSLGAARFYPRYRRMSSQLMPDGEQPKGSMTLTYDIDYHTASNQPDVAKAVVATN